MIGKYIILGILGAVLLVCFGMLIKTTIDMIVQKRHIKKVVKFFETHKPTEGAFLECEKVDGDAKLTYEFQGKYKPSKPNYRCSPNEYYVTVTINKSTDTYITTASYTATYRIAKDDYKALKNKKMWDRIEIKPNWVGVDYMIIPK